MKIFHVVGVLLAWLSLPAMATAEVLQARARGAIEIAADGTVSSFKLSTDLGEGVDAFVRDQVLGWRFNPVEENGLAVPVRARAELVLQAVPEGRNVAVRVAEARFFEVAASGTDMATSAMRAEFPPPHYPRKALDAGVGGDVVVVLEMGADGRVKSAEVERIDLLSDALLRGGDADRFAGQLEKAVRNRLPDWRVSPEALVADDITRLRVPISFRTDHAWKRLYSAIRNRVEEGPRISDVDPGGMAASRRIALETVLEPLTGS